MRRIPSWLGATTVLLYLSLGTCAADDAPSDRAISIQEAIRDLDSDRFAERRLATRRLISAGRQAIGPLAAAARRGGPEVIHRAVGVLNRLSYSADANTASLAKDTLSKLAQSNNPQAAREARAAIRSRQDTVVARIVSLGGRVSDASGKVTSVYFDGTEVKDDDLRLLLELPDLTYLSLGGTRVGDVGMIHVGRLTNLQRLNLYRTRVGNEGLKQVKRLRNLTSLPAGETRITNAGLVHLKDMTQLDYLGLRGNNISDAGLVHLAGLTNLTGLYLGETRVTDAGLVHLKKMTKMAYLRLHTMRVSDVAIAHLKVFTNLERLDIYDTQITPRGIGELQRALPNCVINNEG